MKGSPIIIHATNLQPPRSVDSKKKKKSTTTTTGFMGSICLLTYTFSVKTEILNSVMTLKTSSHQIFQIQRRKEQKERDQDEVRKYN